MAESSYQGRSISFLEFVESAAIEDSTQDISHREVSFVVNGNNSVELVRVKEWLINLDFIVTVLFVMAFVPKICYD